MSIVQVAGSGAARNSTVSELSVNARGPLAPNPPSTMKKTLVTICEPSAVGKNEAKVCRLPLFSKPVSLVALTKLKFGDVPRGTL